MVTECAATRQMVRRFVAGDTLDQAVEAVRHLNRRGMAATLDCLGEAVTSAGEAERARDSYLEAIEVIWRQGLGANVSLKLTQLGLDIDERLCERNLRSIVERASASGGFVRVDMEGAAYTDRTLALVRRLRAAYPRSIGPVIQAYLYRSRDDIAQLAAEGAGIRLCKGAYREPKTVAFPKKRDVDANYVRLTQDLLKSGIYHGIATHDPVMINAVLDFCRQNKISRDAFEFQMLYGIRPDLQQILVSHGWRLRLYVPYGRAWFPYFMRRLAERPANLWFLLKNIFRR
ncbi:MAG: proline dehydrogenase family protein [bacterium]|nr:proline dehydrogenase family protein [bacterium]